MVRAEVNNTGRYTYKPLDIYALPSDVQLTFDDWSIKISPQGEVTLVNGFGVVQATAPLNALAQIMTDYTAHKNLFTTLMPRGCRIVRQTIATTTFLIELEPGIHILQTAKRGYEMAMPWQYFVLHFKKVANGRGYIIQPSQLFWSKTRITDLSASVQIARLPNINQRSGEICLGNAGPESDLPLVNRVDALVRDFFSPGSKFNADLGWNLPNQYKGLGYWSGASHRDPFCWLKWSDWERADRVHVKLTRVIPPYYGGLEIDFGYVSQRLKEAGKPKW